MGKSEKFYQVFISSTYKDLQKERFAIMQYLSRTKFEPKGMELFPSGKPDIWDLIKEEIDQCDLYILITAGRYGSVFPGDPDEKSFTEHEFEYAQKQGKPILVYKHADPDSHNPEMSADEGSDKKNKLTGYIIASKIKDSECCFILENYKIKERLAQAKMTTAGANLQIAENKLQLLTEVIDKFTIVAPENGMLMYAKDINAAIPLNSRNK